MIFAWLAETNGMSNTFLYVSRMGPDWGSVILRFTLTVNRPESAAMPDWIWFLRSLTGPVSSLYVTSRSVPLANAPSDREYSYSDPEGTTTLMGLPFVMKNVASFTGIGSEKVCLYTTPSR